MKADRKANELGLESWFSGLRTLTALPEEQGLIPSTHISANNHYNSSPRGSDSVFHSPGMHYIYMVPRHVCMQHIDTHEIYPNKSYFKRIK